MRTFALLLVMFLAGGFVYLFVTAEAPVAEEATPDASDTASVPDTTKDFAESEITKIHEAFTDSRQCAECHQAVYDEWLGSQHERAWKNPLVAQISDQFRNKICIDCHAPRPVLETGLERRVLARMTERDDGVNCFSCHAMGGGKIAASRSGLSAPCNPIFDARLQTVEHCAVCHNQHGTIDEWRETDYAKMDPPMDCAACHMPEVERILPDGSSYMGRNHRMLAGHDIDIVRQAPVLEAEIVGDTVQVAVTNKAGGHNFPTDERHRAVDLVVRILDDSGNLVGEERRDRYRNPYRDEVGLQNTQIRWNETRSYEWDLEVPSGTVDVKLIYKLTPYIPDDEGQLIFEKKLEFGR